MTVMIVAAIGIVVPTVRVMPILVPVAVSLLVVAVTIGRSIIVVFVTRLVMRLLMMRRLIVRRAVVVVVVMMPIFTGGCGDREQSDGKSDYQGLHSGFR